MTLLLSPLKTSAAMAIAFVIAVAMVIPPSAVKAAIGTISYPAGSETEGFPCHSQSYRHQ